MRELEEIVGEFLVESFENLDRFDQDLLALERDPSDRDVLRRLFRTMHTVKGTSSSLGFNGTSSLAHSAENLLGLLRDGEQAITETSTTALLAAGDALRRILHTIEDTGDEGHQDIAPLLEAIERPQCRTAAGASSAAADSPKENASERRGSTPEQAQGGPRSSRLGELLIERGEVTADAVAAAIRQQDLGDPRRLGEILVEEGLARPEAVAQTVDEQRKLTGGCIARTSLRVDVEVLDELMELVAQLTVVHERMAERTERAGDAALAEVSRHLDAVTRQLQVAVERTRMRPIATVWSRLPRLVRDVAVGCGKQVRVEMSGHGTELDGTIVEAIRDPLTHLVRNAVDHGVETPAARIAAGKPREGRVTLHAHRQGEHVRIDIGDDGAGIDDQALRRAAVRHGVITAAQAAGLSDGEAIDLIFAPGVSTAQRLTSVSGRGVGMDVVRTNVARIGGTVLVATQPGAGTVFTVEVPLRPGTAPLESAPERRAHGPTFVDVGLARITKSIWAETLGIDVEPCRATAGHGSEQRVVTAVVQTLQDRPRAVIVATTERGATQLAARLLGIPADEVRTPQMVDSIGELTSAVASQALEGAGGRLEASCPVVSVGGDCQVGVPGTELEEQVGFRCDGELVLIATAVETVRSCRQRHLPRSRT